MRKGNTYQFLGTPYPINNKGLFKDHYKLQPGDKVLIHPIPGKSQAKQSYPAVVTESIVPWGHTTFAVELVLKGRDENKNWHGAVLNEYGFSRLEFVK